MPKILGTDTYTPPAYANSPHLLLHKVASQSVTSSVYANVTWSSEARCSGPDTWWDSANAGNIVMPWAGLYHVDFWLQWDVNATGGRHATLEVTTTEGDTNRRISHAMVGQASGEQGFSLHVSGYLNVPSAGTTYRVWAWQNSGSSLNLVSNALGGGTIPYFGCTFLGA